MRNYVVKVESDCGGLADIMFKDLRNNRETAIPYISEEDIIVLVGMLFDIVELEKIDQVQKALDERKKYL